MDTIGVPLSKKAVDAPVAPSAAEKQSAYAQQLAEVPEFTTYGSVLNSSTTPAQLTESETEYQVNCVKHIFKGHVVFQVSLHFSCQDGMFSQLFFDSSTYPIRYLIPFLSKFL